MPKHRGLNLHKFISAIPPHLREQYCNQLDVEPRPVGWQWMHDESLEKFLNDPKNATARGPIIEDFQRINDICIHGTTILVRAYKQFHHQLVECPTQEAAMWLFLNDRRAFEYAWSYYLLHYSPSKLTIHHLNGSPFKIGDLSVILFSNELEEYFKGLAKGKCKVSHFPDGDKTVILISRGSYERIVAHWQGDDVHFTSFRPASEDVLIYDPKASELTMKCGLAKDREKYLQTFATCIVGNEQVADAAAKEGVFSLAPITEGTFDYAGNGVISSIQLVKLRMKLERGGDEVLDVTSDNVLQTLANRLPDLNLGSCEPILARFRCNIRAEGKEETTVTFEIKPPGVTDLAQKAYADIIAGYLEEQRVKIRLFGGCWSGSEITRRRPSTRRSCFSCSPRISRAPRKSDCCAAFPVLGMADTTVSGSNLRDC